LTKRCQQKGQGHQEGQQYCLAVDDLEGQQHREVALIEGTAAGEQVTQETDVEEMLQVVVLAHGLLRDLKGVAQFCQQSLEEAEEYQWKYLAFLAWGATC
jgi:hypothetical protein